jgi:hypothetical protein
MRRLGIRLTFALGPHGGHRYNGKFGIHGRQINDTNWYNIDHRVWNRAGVVRCCSLFSSSHEHFEDVFRFRCFLALDLFRCSWRILLVSLRLACIVLLVEACVDVVIHAVGLRACGKSLPTDRTNHLDAVIFAIVVDRGDYVRSFSFAINALLLVACRWFVFYIRVQPDRLIIVAVVLCTFCIFGDTL